MAKMKKIDNISDTYLMNVSAIQVDSDGNEIDSPSDKSVQPSDKFFCDRSYYCIGHKIPFFPYDIWHAVNSYDGRVNMGLKNTTGLYDKESSILEIRYNGKKPVAYTVLKKHSDMLICPFSEIEEGQIKCKISSVKPMVCKLNPLTVRSLLRSNVVTWNYYAPVGDIEIPEPITVKEKVGRTPRLLEAMNKNAKAMGIIAAYSQKGLDKESMGQLMFNFDAPLQYGKLGECAKVNSFEELMRANFFVMHMLLGAKQDGDENKKGK